MCVCGTCLSSILATPGSLIRMHLQSSATRLVRQVRATSNLMSNDMMSVSKRGKSRPRRGHYQPQASVQSLIKFCTNAGQP